MRHLRITVSVYLFLLLFVRLAGWDGIWGAYHLTFLPDWLAWVLTASSITILWLPTRITGFLSKTIDRGLSGPAHSTVYGILFACLTGLFIIVKSENLLLGDSYRLLPLLKEPISFSPTEHLTLLALRFLHDLLGRGQLVYHVVGVASGAVFLWIISMFVRRVLENGLGRLAGLAMIIGLAQIQFFFGYIENYTIMTALACLYLYCGWIAIVRRQYVWWAFALLVIAGAFHLTALFLAPGIVYLFWTHGSSKRAVNPYKIAALTMIMFSAVGSAVFYFRFHGDEIFCPIVASELNPYSLFSAQHITDVANLMLLIAPLPLLLILSASRQIRPRELVRDRQSMFLLYCTLGGLALLFFVDPKLGAVRDWDLLSLYGIPIAFLAFAVWIGGAGERISAMSILQAAIAVLLLHTVPWVASNTSPGRTIAHTKLLISEDVHYSAEYYHGDRLLSWGLMLANEYQDIEEMQRCFKIRLQAIPNDTRARSYYAWSCIELGDSVRASQALGGIRDLASLNQAQLEYVTALHIRLHELDRAIYYLDYIDSKFGKSFDFFFISGYIQYLQGNTSDAVSLYQNAFEMDTTRVDFLLNYAAFAIDIADLELADDLLRMALSTYELSVSDKAVADQLAMRLSAIRQTGQ